MEWQPIETAPKDGTWVLMYYPEGGGWDLDAEVFVPLMAVMHDPDGRGYWKGYYSGIGPNGDPTRWMPLPPAPSSTQQGEGK